MADMTNYQGGGDIRLSGFVGGVYNAFRQSEEKKAAEEKARQAREEKSQELFQQQLAKTMAAVSSKGLQQKDIPGFQKLYSQMEDAYISAEQNSGDKSKRLLALAKMKELATQATVYVQQSEQLGKKKTEYMKMLQTQYDKFDAESALKALNAHYDRPLDQVTSDFDIMNYRHKWDNKGVESALEDVQKTLFRASSVVPTETLVNSTRNGYDIINTFQSVRQIPQAEAVEGLRARYNTDTNFKRYVDTEFDGTLDSKLTQLYQNLGPTWGREVKNATRTQGRAPVRSSGGSSGSSSSSSDDEPSVNTNVDIAFAGTNVATASKQASLKGNGMKARLAKNVRAYDLNTGNPINITSDMQDGTITELVRLPTGEVRGGGRRVLVKGTEDRFKNSIQEEDFAVVRYKKPIYVTTDDRNVVFTGTGKQLSDAIAKKLVVRDGYEDRVGLFPMNTVLPDAGTMTKGEKATIDKYKATGTPAKRRQSKVLSNL